MIETHRFKYLKDVYTLEYAKTPEDALLSIAKIKQVSHEERLGLDIETDHLPEWRNHCPKNGPKAGLDPHLTRIRLVQVYDNQNTVYVFDMFSIGDNLFELTELLRRGKWLAHNSVFEQKHIRKLGVDNLDIQCSMVTAMMVDRAERSPFEVDEEDEDEQKLVPTAGYGLDAMCYKYMGVGMDKTFQKANWGLEVIPATMLMYAALDVIACRKLQDILMEKVTQYDMGRSLTLLSKMCPVIAEMESVGMPFDVRAHNKIIKLWDVDLEAAQESTDEYFPKVNLNSPKQMGEWLRGAYPDLVETWPTTDSGNLSFNRTKIAEFKSIPEIYSYLEFRKASKLLSTYGEPMKDFIHPFTKRIHTEFSLGETRTGRLSSRRPNLQNAPRENQDLPPEKSFRRLFKAEEGWSFVVADLSQIELRVAACVSGDPVMLNAIKNGVDLHKLIVSKILHVPIESVTKTQRQLGKALNFGLVFGLGIKGLIKYAFALYDYVLTYEEAKAAFNAYHELYSVLSAWADKQRAFAKKYAYIRTPLGKVRKLAESEMYTHPLNSPIQGGAAEALECGMVYLYSNIRRVALTKAIKIASTVHDEVVLLAKHNYEEQAYNMLTKNLERGCLKIFPNMPTFKLCEGGWGPTWGEAK